jgi:hypothetical protein
VYRFSNGIDFTRGASLREFVCVYFYGLPKLRNKWLLTDNSVELWWVTAGPQARHRLRLTHHTTDKLSRCDLIVNLAVVVNLVFFFCKELIIYYLIVRFCSRHIASYIKTEMSVGLLTSSSLTRDVTYLFRWPFCFNSFA